MSSFNYSNDFDRPFSDLNDDDRAWLMTKVWARLKIYDLAPAKPADEGYLPPSNSAVYQIWSTLREHAKLEDCQEASDWWRVNGFAVERKAGLAPSPAAAAPVVEQEIQIEEVADEAKNEIARESKDSPTMSFSDEEIIDHFLNHSSPFTDPQTVLLMFRWFELETSEVSYQAGHFRSEMDKRGIKLKNVDATLNALTSKSLIECIASVPRKTYRLTKEGKQTVGALVALCPDPEEGEPLIS